MPGPSPFVLSSPYDQKLANGELLPTIDPETIIGRTFNLPPKPNGEVDEVTAVEIVQQYEDDVYNNPEHVKFRCTMNGEAYEDLISYNQVLDYLEEEGNRIYKFVRIVSHQGPLDTTHPDYKGSKYNLLVEWEGYSEPTPISLRQMIKDDWVTATRYAIDHNLLGLDGWKRA